MAERGSTKYLSVKHENHIAALYKGRRSRSSGAAEHDQGDVRTPEYLIECKMTGNPGKVKRGKIVSDMEKITEEAWSEDKVPVLALRYFDPDSILADKEGWIDLVVKRVVDDV
jgi:hypothetical protein